MKHYDNALTMSLFLQPVDKMLFGKNHGKNNKFCLYLYGLLLLLSWECVMLGLEVCMNCTVVFHKDTYKCIFCLGAPACLNVFGSFKQINDDDNDDNDDADD